MLEKPQAVEIYDLVDALHSCKQASGKSVSAHVLEMKGYMDQLHALGKSYDNDMAINLINRSLNKDFDKASTPQVLTIQKGRENKPKSQANKKDKSKGKTDKKKKVVPYQPKPKHNPLKRKENPNKDQTCHHCYVAGHWKRNYPLYREELRKNKDKAEHGAAASSNLFTIELFNLTYKLNSWVYDMGCGTHVCNTLQGFKKEMKLSYGEQYLQVGNGAQAAVEAIGVFDLVLPSERRNRTLLDMARSMFNLTTLPLSFWDYTLEFAVWGCEAYVKRDSADKIHQRFVKCIFVEYPKETMGYYFYFPPENKVIIARYGNFLERDFISQKFSGRDNDLEDDHMDTLPFENTSEIPVESKSLGSPPELIHVCRSERTTRAPNRICLNIEVEDDEVRDLGEPTNYKAAMLDPDKVIWQSAKDEEINSMKVMKVWI
nr:hypothetical protein [Tanacetum cinerariifolium]